MRFKVRKTERCVALRFESDGFNAQPYVTTGEIDKMLSVMLPQAVTDCGQTVVVRYGSITVIDDPGIREGVGQARTLTVAIDPLRFFGWVSKMIADGKLPEKFMTVDSASFNRNRSWREELGWAQIFGHPRFNARKKLGEVLAVASAKQVSELRGHVSRMLQMGRTVTPDHAKASFYFYAEDGNGYNGGIIWHGEKSGFSVHT